MSKTLAQIQSEINADLNERTEQIWQWVRDNRNSLDSERGCRMIREGIDSATESVCEAIQPMLAEIANLKVKVNAAKLALKITQLTRQLGSANEAAKVS